MDWQNIFFFPFSPYVAELARKFRFRLEVNSQNPFLITLLIRLHLAIVYGKYVIN